MKNIKIKKNLFCFILVVIFILILFFALKNTFFINKYDITKPISSYKLDKKTEKQYLKFISQSLTPKLLRNFINYETIALDELNTTSTGYDVLEKIKYNAYTQLFESLFNKKRLNFDDVPVTSKFRQKFKNNLADAFNIKNEFECGIFMDTKTLNVREYVPIDIENEKIIQFKFIYELDCDGNIDDIVLLSSN